LLFFVILFVVKGIPSLILFAAKTGALSWKCANQLDNSVSGSTIPAFRQCLLSGCPANGRIHHIILAHSSLYILQVICVIKKYKKSMAKI
jgi:hypothetical protein